MILDTEKLVIDMRSLSRGMNRGCFDILLNKIDWKIDDVEPEENRATLELAVDYENDVVRCTGSLNAVFRTPCARCLEPSVFSITEPVNRSYTWDSDPSGDQVKAIVSQSGELDILGAVREAVLLSIPGKPLCSPDCAGICYN